MLGRYRDARIIATEGRQLALDLGQPFWADWMRGTLAYLAAVGGDEQECREYAGQVRATEESVAAAPWAEAAFILLDLGAGRVVDALVRIEAAVAGPARHHPNITRMAPDQVEAAVRLGRPDSAAAALARFSRWAPLVGQPWAAALQARCQALTAPNDEAERHYRLALHEQDTRPFDRARTQLVYGEFLRRAKRKREARIQLHAALRAFESLGARPVGGPCPRRAHRHRCRRPSRRRSRHPGRAHPAGAADHPARRARHAEPRHRRTSVPQPAHRRLPPVQGLPQARNQLPRGAAGAAARLRCLGKDKTGQMRDETRQVRPHGVFPGRAGNMIGKRGR